LTAKNSELQEKVKLLKIKSKNTKVSQLQIQIKELTTKNSELQACLKKNNELTQTIA
jgi:hypothetical protein